MMWRPADDIPEHRASEENTEENTFILSGSDSEQASEATRPADEKLADLLEQGFTQEEAERLMRFAARNPLLTEDPELPAIMRRLEFYRWMVETGRLDGDTL